MPEEADLLRVFTVERYRWAIRWYWTMIVLHAYLALTHFATLLDLGSIPKHYLLNIQTVAVLFQMFILCMMLQLFGTSEVNGELSERVVDFKMWLIFEIFMIITIIGTTMFYMLFRAVYRGSYIFEMEATEGRIDLSQDFMSNHVTVIILSVAQQ